MSAAEPHQNMLLCENRICQQNNLPSFELHVSFNRPIKRARAAARRPPCSLTFWSAEGKASRQQLGGSARSSPNASSSSWTAATLSKLWTPPTDCWFFSTLLPTRVQSAAMNFRFSSYNNVFSSHVMCVMSVWKQIFRILLLMSNLHSFLSIFVRSFFAVWLRFPVTMHYTWLMTECSSIQLVFLKVKRLRDLKGFLYVLISLGIFPGVSSLAEMKVTSADLKNGAEAEMPSTVICWAPTSMLSFINYEINTFLYKWDLNCPAKLSSKK